MLNEMENRIRASAAGALERTLAGGAARFERARMLPRLIPAGPDLIADESRAGRLAVVKLLARALRGERRLGRAGHWTYSLDRHLGLIQAWRAERAALAALRPPRRPDLHGAPTTPAPRSHPQGALPSIVGTEAI